MTRFKWAWLEGSFVGTTIQSRFARRKCVKRYKFIIKKNPWISNLVHTTHFWNNLHQVRSKLKDKICWLTMEFNKCIVIGYLHNYTYIARFIFTSHYHLRCVISISGRCCVPKSIALKTNNGYVPFSPVTTIIWPIFLLK